MVDCIFDPIEQTRENLLEYYEPEEVEDILSNPTCNMCKNDSCYDNECK